MKRTFSKTTTGRATAKTPTLRHRLLRFLSVFGQALSLVLPIQQANASLITNSHRFQLQISTIEEQGNFTDSLALPFDQFDPTLGTLTGVTIDVETLAFYIRGEVILTNSSEFNVVGSTLVRARVASSMVEPDLAITHSAITDHATCTAQGASILHPNGTACHGEYGSTSPSSLPSNEIVLSDQESIAQFVGTGSLLTDFRMGLTVESAPGDNPFGGISLDVYNRAFWGGEAQISYEYIPVPVPEPPVLLLMAVALCGLGFIQMKAGRSRFVPTARREKCRSGPVSCGSS